MPDKELLGKENKNLLEILKTIQQYGMGALSQKEMKQFLDADIQGDLDKEIKEREELISGERDGEYLSGEERKAVIRKRRMKASKFFGREEKETAADTTGTSSLVIRSKTGKIDKNKLIPEPTEEKGGVLAEILTGVNSIVDTLKGQQKQDKKHQSWLQKLAERFKRRKKENKLEFKIFDGLKKTVTKVLAPMKSAWSKFIEFIGNILLGNVLFKILNWMGNKDNQGKLNSIIRFFEDWWPVMLGAYLIFGNALTGFALGLLKNVVVWGAKLVATVIPALLKAAVAMGPWGLAAAAVLGGGIYLATREKKEPDQGMEESSDQGMEESSDQEMGDDGTTTERTSDSFTTSGGPEAEQLKNQMAESRGEETQGFKEGGLVQHYNNATQQVSNIIQGFNEGGLVQHYNNATQKTSNIIQGFNEGGLVQHYNNATQQASNIIQGFNEGGTVMNNQNMMMGDQNMMMGDQTQNEEQFNVLNPFNIIRLLGVINQADEGEGQFGGGFTGRMMERRRTLAETQGLKQGGVVSGPGGVDKVPARLTAGEFVMSKGAVQKYGVNTLAAMNAAGGGTNIPTLMGGKPGYAGGGEVTSYQQLVEKGGIINDHGNVGGERIVEVLFPPEKKGLFGRKIKKRRALYSSTSEVDTPIEEFLNSRLGGGSTTKPKSSKGTGFIKGLGNIFSGKTFSGEDRIRPQRGKGQGNKIRAVGSTSKQPDIGPSEKKKNVIRAYEEEKNKMSDRPNIEKSNSEIPQFNVMGGRSAPKIKVLGISV